MYYPKDGFSLIKNLTTSETWVPVVYRRGVWKQIYTDEPINDLMWNEGEPNGFEREPCVHTTAGGDKLNDNVCHQDKNTLCHFTSHATMLRLTGMADFAGDFIFEPDKNLEFLEFKNLWSPQKISYFDSMKSWVLINNHEDIQQSEYDNFFIPNKQLYN